MAIVAGIFAIGVVKELFGGIGAKLPKSPLAARYFINYLALSIGTYTYDGVAGATPLRRPASLFDLFIGDIPGTIGEVSKIGYSYWSSLLII